MKRIQFRWVRKHLHQLLNIAITITCIIGIALIFAGYRFQWAWTGFNKTLWDWMQLLIVPIVLALVAVWFSRIGAKREQALTHDSQQEAVLQGYLDRMSELLLKEKLRTSQPNDEVRNVARVRTLTVLCQLDGKRNSYVLEFLRESRLIHNDVEKSIITLNGADLSKVDLNGVNLSGVNLNGVNLCAANLSRANLSRVSLIGSNLSHVNLISANLSEVDLSKANLSEADFCRAYLWNVNFSGADLLRADLSRASLWNVVFNGAALNDTNLKGADLWNTNLCTAKLTNTKFKPEQLKAVNR